MKIKNTQFILFFSLILLTFCGEYSDISGSGKPTQKIVNVPDFKGVIIQNGIEAIIKIDTINKIIIETDENFIEYVKIDVKNSVLEATINKNRIKTKHVKFILLQSISKAYLLKVLLMLQLKTLLLLIILS